VELFADAIVSRRWREQEKKNQMYSLDFSFLLSLTPPLVTAPNVISRKAFYQWAVTHGGTLLDMARGIVEISFHFHFHFFLLCF
jgi:hypothetical protein